jgi:3'-5' exoribonuclease
MGMKTICEKGKMAADIVPGEEARGLFLIGAAGLQQARNGPFWRLELRDATGSLEARVWSPISREYSELPAGRIVEIEGRAEVFRDQVQLGVSRLRLLSEEEAGRLDVADFLASSSRPAQDMLAEIEAMCRRELRHKPWRRLMDSLFRDEDVRARLMTATAARTIHHAWAGGLLEHMLGVARLCLAFGDLYPELDRQILLVGALTHDVGKLWELSGDLANDYTDEGRLVGHTSLGLEKLDPHIRKSGLSPDLALHLRHLVLSHHGLPEYGAAREPLTPEAFALHHADNVDAKLVQLRTLFTGCGPEDSAWSPYQATLRRAVFHAPRTPSTPPTPPASGDERADRRKRENDIPPGEDQCSLL